MSAVESDWVTPPTGGEAYIPLAADKRARSERIMAEAMKKLRGDSEKSDDR